MGRPQFADPGTRGSGKTVATTNRPELAAIDATATGSVASGATETTEVYAPAGSVYRFKTLRMVVKNDATATSGTHSLSVRPLSHSTTLYGESNYNASLKLNGRLTWISADRIKEPSTESGLAQAIQNMMATETAALAFRYTNNTDAAQDNDRQYTLTAEEAGY